MHTFVYLKALNTYEVRFVSEGNISAIRQCQTEDEAAAYVSYLNGGADPRLTRRQLDPRYNHGEHR